MDERVKNIFIPHLRSQFERGLPVLVIGAGFSLGAKNIEGDELPSVDRLKRKLWELCFPGETFEELPLYKIFTRRVFDDREMRRATLSLSY